MRKNKKGFTLIELLAIIVILAIIAVITVPLILNIIDDSKKGAAKDSSYGYKKGVENFYLSKISQDNSFKFENRTYTTEELKNLGLQVSGQEPNSGEVVFENNMIKSFTLEYDKYICDYSINNDVNCSENTGLIIKSIDVTSTHNSISITVDIEGTATSYEYKINDGEFETSNSNTYTFNNLNESTEYEITIKVKIDSKETTKTKKITTKEKPLDVGAPISYGGYNWHVIRNYEDNGTTYQTLLMDAGQLEKMEHCTLDENQEIYCDYDGEYYIYSWNKSKIQLYLNTTFINNLQTNGANINEIKNETVCIDPSIGGSENYSYGGYLKEEVDLLEETCSNYENYKIRLISMSEYIKLSNLFAEIELPFSGLDNGGKLANLEGIERLSASASASWLYNDTIGDWWTMSTHSGTSSNAIGYANNVEADGDIKMYRSSSSYDIRPVITLIK